MDKIIFSIQKEKLPFLDLAGLEYKVINPSGTSPEPIMAAVNARICSIEIEASPVALIDYGRAMVMFGEAKAARPNEKTKLTPENCPHTRKDTFRLETFCLDCGYTF